MNCMTSRIFALLKTTLQQALATKMHQYCCNNAVPLLNKAKTLTFDAYDSPLACKRPNAVTKSL